MSATTPAPRARTRALKTWSSFGELGRRPSDYEIVTQGMNHTVGSTPLEMGPDVQGNVWLRTHRDGIRLAVPDWERFRDPDALTYATYVVLQDDQETYVEGLLAEFDGSGYDAALTGSARDFLKRVSMPTRYLAHGLQMLSAHIQQLAPSGYIANCASFQTADQLRRVQLVAYRTTQLRLTFPDAGFGSDERDTWENDVDWQPLRRGIELALLEFDWDRAVVATNLVVKPVADLITLRAFSARADAVGARLDALVAENLWRDSLRSQRWSASLVRFLIESEPANRTVLGELLDELSPLGEAMIDGGSHLVASSGGPDAAQVAAVVREQWSAFLEEAGLSRMPA